MLSGELALASTPGEDRGSIRVRQLATRHVVLYEPETGLLVAFRRGPEAHPDAVHSIAEDINVSRSSGIEHIRIDARDCERAILTTGVSALFPFYVWKQDGQHIRFGWRLTECLRDGKRTVDHKVISAFINHREEYSVRTPLVGVTQLTERAQINVDADRISVLLPEDYRAPLPSNIREDAEAVPALAAVLGWAASQTQTKFHVELSGGHDSTLIALLPESKGHESYGILFDGIAGEHQRQRRELICGLQLLTDHTIRFADEMRSGLRLSDFVSDPRLDLYGPLTSLCIDRFEMNGSCIVTGIGGDEVMSQEAPADSPLKGKNADGSDLSQMPKSRVPETALLAACSRFQSFQRVGAWPVHPYLHPEVLEFTERLPLRLSQGRVLQKAAIDALSQSRVSIDKSPPENFVQAFQTECVTSFGKEMSSREFRLESYRKFRDRWGLQEIPCECIIQCEYA